MVLHPVPAFADNYIWVLHNGTSAVVVDPGESEPVMTYLHTHRLQAEAILVTHHHADHTGGVKDLRQATGAKVLGPAGEWADMDCERVWEGSRFELLGLDWQVYDVPGHTADHVAYVAYNREGTTPPWLFCGDTLFSGGCGRLFEGTPDQMLASLDKLATLPDETWVCCTHEYTLSNLRFAAAVDPDNAALHAWQAESEARRSQGRPTLPSRMDREKAVNPFLRVRQPALVEAARRHSPSAKNDSAVFAALREWKNNFR